MNARDSVIRIERSLLPSLGRTSEALLDGDALASELRGVLGQMGDEDEPVATRQYRAMSWVLG